MYIIIIEIQPNKLVKKQGKANMQAYSQVFEDNSHNAMIHLQLWRGKYLRLPSHGVSELQFAFVGGLITS